MEPGPQQGGDLPATSVSWLEAREFCRKLSQREGATYRLPTEAEWEYACRAGGGDPPVGREELEAVAWYADNSEGTTHSVGLKKPNALGLYDMYGNVPEWVWDRYDPLYYKRMPLIDPPGSSQGTSRIYRGGGWNVAAAQTRASAREGLGMTYSVLTSVGMRVARNAP